MHVIDEQVFKAMHFHVFDAESQPCAVCAYPEDAAALVSVLGDGACITDPNCAILWTEGQEDFPASESYDSVAEKVHERLAALKKVKP